MVIAAVKASTRRKRALQRNAVHILTQAILASSIILCVTGLTRAESTHGSRRRRDATVGLIHHDLYPTAARYQVKQLRRRLGANASLGEAFSNWFLPEHNAVYATIPEPDPSNRHLTDFYELRHLSRYEQAYRKEHGLDLMRRWNGTYNFHELHRMHSFMNVNVTIRNATAEHANRLLLETTSHGGRYDNYQAVPLSQGYGTHFANVWVGSPTPQRKTVIVDTGSHYTAFPCSGCQNWYVSWCTSAILCFEGDIKV
jgi:hypothetical protein